MICVFCQQPIQLVTHTNSDMLDLRECRNCQYPTHKTLCRKLYDKLGILLAESFKIDEYYVNRIYGKSSITNRDYYSVIYKDVIGIFNDSPDIEPMSLSKPVCEIDHILDLPFHDIELLKKKLATYTMFS